MKRSQKQVTKGQKGISRLCIVLIVVPSTPPSHLIERVLLSSFYVAFKLFFISAYNYF